MPVIKSINKPYRKSNDLKNLVAYAVKPTHCLEGIYGAQGLIKSDALDMWKQMQSEKEHFRKTDGKQAHHYIVSFSEREMQTIGPLEAQAIGYKACRFFEDYQVVFGVHTNEDNLHIHFILNSVSYKNGIKLTMNPARLAKFKRYVECIVAQCCAEAAPTVNGEAR